MKPYQSSVMRRFIKRGNPDIQQYFRVRHEALVAQWTASPPFKGNLRGLKKQAELTALAETYNYVKSNEAQFQKQIIDYDKMFGEAENY